MTSIDVTQHANGTRLKKKSKIKNQKSKKKLKAVGMDAPCAAEFLVQPLPKPPSMMLHHGFTDAACAVLKMYKSLSSMKLIEDPPFLFPLPVASVSSLLYNSLSFCFSLLLI
jgi:hypothetical protein